MRFFKKIIIGLLAFFMLSCTERFEEYATPATTANMINPRYLFTRALVTGSGISVGIWQFKHQISGSYWAQHFANIQSNFWWDNFRPTPGDQIWNWYYAREHFAPLHLNYHVLKLSRQINNPIKEGKARIWNVYMFHFITDTYGDIPYFEAFESLTPRFDSQRDIYADMLKELEEAVQQLRTNRNLGFEGFGAADVLYNGNIDQWIRFGNTLLLRLALRVSNVAENELTRPFISRLNMAELLQSNADNAIMRPDPLGPTFHVRNPLPFVFNWHEVRMSNTMFEILSGNSDPRMQVMFNPNVNGVFRGLRNGQHPDTLSMRHTTFFRPQFSNIGNFFIQPQTPLFMLTFAEANFLRAEAISRGFASGDVRFFYEQGIRASFLQLGISDETIIQTYLNGNARFNPANALTQIYTQRWIALFPNGAEAWALVRQTGVPRMQQVVFHYPGNPEMPRRISFPVNERRFNTANYNNAVARMGGDSQYTRVWWDGGQ